METDILVKKQYKFMILGLLSPVVALISIFSLFLVDYEYIYIGAFVIYSIFLIIEFTQKLYSPITIALWLIYVVFFCLNIMQINEFNYYIGSVIYFTLFCLFFISVIIKKYPTLVYDYDKSGSYHRHTAILWSFIYCIAFCSSYYLIPDLLYITLPLGIIATGCLLTIYNGFFSVYPLIKANKISKKKILNKDMHFAICNYKNLKHANLINNFMCSYFALGDDYYLNNLKNKGFNIIYAYEKNDSDIKIIATMICNTSSKISISQTQHFDFAKLNNKLKCAQVDDLIIDKAYRNTPDMIVALFTIGLEIAMVNLVKLLITFSTKESITMFKKIGFEKLPQDPIAKINTYGSIEINGPKESTRDLYPMIYNLSESIVKVEKSSATYNEYNGQLNKRLLEYYVKRNLFSPLFLNWERRDFNLKANDINKIIESSGALKC